MECPQLIFPPVFSPSAATLTCIIHTLLLLGRSPPVLHFLSPFRPGPQRLQLMAHCEPFLLQRSHLPSPTQALQDLTCFGPQCPQKLTGCTGESYKTSEAGPVLSYEGD